MERDKIYWGRLDPAEGIRLHRQSAIAPNAMSLREKREFIQTQILETDRLLELTGDHPLMAPALAQRKAEFERELKELPPPAREPRTVLFFAGGPVLGTRGIDAQFASNVIDHFLQMVKSQYSAAKHGDVGRRGVRRGESEARLLLTGTPRGSFGLELSQPDSEDFVAAEQLSDVLVQLTKVIEYAGKDDESFAFALDDVSPRVLQRLKEFFKLAFENKARMRIVSGDLECQLDEAAVAQAFDRVSAAETDDQTVEMPGVFRGATHDTWRFDFRSEGGEHVSGRLGDDVTPDEALEMIRLTDVPSVATIHRTLVTTRSGVLRTRYELIGLRRAEADDGVMAHGSTA